MIHFIPPAYQKSVFGTAIQRVKPGGALLYKDMADHPAFQVPE